LPSAPTDSVTASRQQGFLGARLTHTILIVDDSPAIRRLLRHCVEHDGTWEVCGEAENGAIAVEKASQLAPDVVILDWQMPVMNGLEAARQIAQASPQTVIVMFTWHSCDLILGEARAAGVGYVLSKTDSGTSGLLSVLKNISVTQKTSL